MRIVIVAARARPRAGTPRALAKVTKSVKTAKRKRGGVVGRRVFHGAPPLSLIMG
jgi:hypothetical protein